MSIIPAGVPLNFNATLLNNTDLCTLKTCPLVLAHVDYIPNLAGNVLYAAIFGLAIITQTFFAIKYRTWGYGVAMFGGLTLEIIGYVARIQMHFNPFSSNPFLMYLVCLTIGPAFLSAAIYLCLSRIVVVYSESVAWLRPASYTLIFVGCDFFSLLLQAAGGGIASGATTTSMDTIGKDLMVAGVAFQVGSLALFTGLCLEFALRIRKVSEVELNPFFASFRATRKFKLFLCGLGAATLTIFIRSVFRCAELSGGFRGPLANQQVTFMILEGAMICIAVICLTAFHPGLVFGPQWHVAVWNIRSTPKTMEEKTASQVSVDAQPSAET